jgi:hypothetical protein
VNLVSNVPGVSFSTNLVGSEIRIEWYDPTGGSNPITLGNGRLLTINVLPIGEGGESSPLVFGDQCALGDPEGDPITGVEYIDGMCHLSDAGTVDEGDELVPKALMLNSGRPNPFRPRTILTYSLPQSAHVDLVVFDVKGRCVATLMDADQVAGVHQTAWNGCDDQGSQVSSGVYLARLRAGGQSRVLKLVRCR